MDKKDIVEVLERIGTMMEIKGENPFKIRAYSAGARTLQTMEKDLGEVIEEGRLGDIPGIGKALTEKIETLYATGELEFYNKLVASVPSGLMDMLDIPGLGGKKIKVLHEKCDKKLADNPKLPYTAYLIEYKEGEEHFFDIAIGDKSVDIFDHYYDKSSKFVNMVQAGGRVNPRNWVDKTPQKK